MGGIKMMNKSWRNVVIGDEPVISGNKGDNSINNGTSTNGQSANSGQSTKDQSTNATSITLENDNKRHERLLIVYAPLVGNRVTVFLYDGAVFEGTLNSFETSGNEFALILRMATMIRPGREVIDPSIKAGITFELMNIRFDDMAELKSAGSGVGGIGTDAAISKRKGDFGKERELHRWTPETDSSSDPSSQQFTNETGTWDQFATNEKLFGLKTDFDEEMYTTKLDRNSAQFRANSAKAERIAKEILSGSTGGNAHLAEERGIKSGEFAEDEEMLYGAVMRENPSGTLPPGFSENKEEEEEEEVFVKSDITTTTSSSNLNPSAPEFKLNANAPEFQPSFDTKVTYYNQPRRNLNYYNNGPNNNYNSSGYYAASLQNSPYSSYPSLPYYYVPPQPVTTQPLTTQPNFTSTPSSIMNPDAADFFMPEISDTDAFDNYNYYAQPPPQYHHHHYGYQQGGRN